MWFVSYLMGCIQFGECRSDFHSFHINIYCRICGCIQKKKPNTPDSTYTNQTISEIKSQKLLRCFYYIFCYYARWLDERITLLHFMVWTISIDCMGNIHRSSLVHINAFFKLETKHKQQQQHQQNVKQWWQPVTT